MTDIELREQIREIVKRHAESGQEKEVCIDCMSKELTKFFVKMQSEVIERTDLTKNIGD